MAISGFGRGKGEGASTAPTTSSSSSSSPGGFGNLTAFIDQGSEFEGKLSFKETVRIDGHFRGEISSENTLIVGESGEIEASIRSKTISISGSVDGDVSAAHKVVLHKTARVNGNVESPSLQMEDGAVLNGMVKMVPAGGGSNKLKSVSGNGGSPKSGDKQ